MSVDFDDRLLAHLQVVIVQRFRQNDPFLMSWLGPLSAGSGRSSTWLSPSLPVHFLFLGSRPPTIDRDWLQRLHESAASSTGLVLTTASGELARAEGPTRFR